MRAKYNLLRRKALVCITIVMLAAGCSHPAQQVNPAPPPRLVAPGGPPVNAGDITPIRDAVTAAIKAHSDLFPKGTDLQSVVIHNRMATLDFNPAFNGLANMGETTESRAQKALRAALAKFPDIDKMNVTVNGKPFDSQATDWTTPFPVRQTEEEKSASRGNE